MSTLTSSDTAPAAETTSALRRLYVTRFAFALTWAVATILVISAQDDPAALPTAVVALFVLYPLFDVAATIADLRSTRSRSTALRVNLAVSVLATVGVAIAGTSGVPAVLRVWGAWAIVAGLAQLAVAITRRGLSGQVPMIISGSVSALAGAAFIAMASQDGATLTAAASYAIPGGILFLVSALRLGRR